MEKECVDHWKQMMFPQGEYFLVDNWKRCNKPHMIPYKDNDINNYHLNK